MSIDSGSGGQVAIVGCGPSGCYTALAVRRLAPAAHITVFDARPTPYGLVRYGVAPDHQGMKNVSKQFDRLFAAERVDFVGNTRVGQDVPLSALENNFDVVVVATGLPEDRRLSVPIDPRARVLGAGQLLRLLNGDPDSTLRRAGLPAPLGAEVVMVGAGNVAMDVARLLCKRDDGFDGSDVDDDARLALNTAGLRRITVLSRSTRERVRWDAAMFTELCALPGVAVHLDGRLATSRIPDDTGVCVDIRFNEQVTRIDADGEYAVVHTGPSSSDGSGTSDNRSQGSTYRAHSVITAMGFVAPSREPGWTATSDRVLFVGGCSSGVLGNLAENRALAKAAAADIVAVLSHEQGRPGLIGVRDQCCAATSFDDWLVVDRAEVAQARPNRLRSKFTAWEAISDVIAEHRHRRL
ncbi:FAD-dependent oxidoreductase [Mycolicibacterium sp. P9-22]|uniref:FAD-dependent oxidoreductase n=1 Tax=Mycolicibacterium sp. P9-22 TaxID=2024613 RepID=UPI001883364F|nr:FAD-dependent oxidoreductase [Mycolicibacterium sp. P9-22]